MLRDIYIKGYAVGHDFAVGLVEKRMTSFANSMNITLASKSLYMGPRTLYHSKRPSKEKKGLAASAIAIVKFIKDRRSMDLYWDGECFIYTDYKNKFIIHPSYELKIKRKKTKKVSYITAGKVTADDQFNDKIKVT